MVVGDCSRRSVSVSPNLQLLKFSKPVASIASDSSLAEPSEVCCCRPLGQSLMCYANLLLVRLPVSSNQSLHSPLIIIINKAELPLPGFFLFLQILCRGARACVWANRTRFAHTQDNFLKPNHLTLTVMYRTLKRPREKDCKKKLQDLANLGRRAYWSLWQTCNECARHTEESGRPGHCVGSERLN